MNLNNRVKNRFEISEILKKLLLRLKKLEQNSNNLPYKTYVAKFTDSTYPDYDGTGELFSDTQKVNVLENTLSLNISWSKITTGIYEGIFNTPIDLKKTVVNIKSIFFEDDGYAIRLKCDYFLEEDRITLRFSDSTNSLNSFFPDNSLFDSKLEIKVYN